jgi:hypothetical protein
VWKTQHKKKKIKAIKLLINAYRQFKRALILFTFSGIWALGDQYGPYIRLQIVTCSLRNAKNNIKNDYAL